MVRKDALLQKKIQMEGPYGHEANYFLQYDTLLLIIGRIGITPFLAMISNILIWYELGETNLPQHANLIWAIQKYKVAYTLKQLFPNLTTMAILEYFKNTS